jgi:hypothetical protein
MPVVRGVWKGVGMMVRIRVRRFSTCGVRGVLSGTLGKLAATGD